MSRFETIETFAAGYNEATDLHLLATGVEFLREQERATMLDLGRPPFHATAVAVIRGAVSRMVAQ